MVRYSNHPDLLAIADQSLEASRMAIHKDARKLGLVRLTAKISYELSRVKNKNYCTTTTEHKALNKKYRQIPGGKSVRDGRSLSRRSL